MNLHEVIDFINTCSNSTKVYIGCDSYRKNKRGKWVAVFTTVVVVHIDGNKGCRIFHEKSEEYDYDAKKNRPAMRMMAEVYRSTEMYLALSPHIEKDIEIHVDVNPDERHGSNVAYSQAIGYIQGVCGVKPKFKPEAWAASCAAHLTQFQGTDNFHALKLVKDYYNTKEVVGFSIPATEHSSVTSWGRDNEYTMIMNYIENHKDNAIIACVMDSYNIYNAVEEVTKGDFKMKIESDEYPIFVIRPDSGDPVSVIGDIISITEKNEVAYTINDKGFKVWNKYRIIWGDGITPETIKDILTFVTDKGYSSDNMAFGSGGDLMQNVNRDTQKFAVKCSAIRTTDGQLIDVFKDPITDKGKASKKGIIELYKNGEGFFTDVRSRAWEDKTRAVLEVVFENGFIVREQTFEDIKMCSEV